MTKARDEAIFLNLIRASHDYPLSFTTISNVTPSLTNTTSFGLPAFLFGPPAVFGTAPGSIASLASSSPGRDVVFGSSTAGNATAVSTNFSVSTQETSSFYEGFLKPIDLQIVDYFIRQGYSREMLFWLFTDAVEVTFANQIIGTRYSPPNDYGCTRLGSKPRCFAQFIQVAVAAGLTVEEKSRQYVVSGSKVDQQSGSGPASSSGKATTVIVPRFCFSKVLQQQAKLSMSSERWEYVRQHYFDRPLETFRPICGSPWDPSQKINQWQPDTFNFYVGDLQFKIVPRSAYGVFEFLGALIKMQTQHLAPTANARRVIPQVLIDEHLKPPTLRTAPQGDDAQLIQVVFGAADNCFVRTSFIDGDYCVPEQAANTKRIFGLLAQLIAIQTAASDLSITPLVRIIQ